MNRSNSRSPGGFQRGFSLVELMIAVTMGLIVVSAVIALFINTTRTNSELARANSQIENGRFAMQLLENDIVHAGYWGGYVPQFDDVTFDSAVPTDHPAAVPEILAAFNTTNWTAAYRNALLGIPIQAWGAAPGCTDPGGGCATNIVTNKLANTDVLAVRHADKCIPGVGACEAYNAGKLYFQANQCMAAAQTGTTNTITLASGSSSTDDFYQNMIVRILGGAGAGQQRTISNYVGGTKVATVSANWTSGSEPDNTSVYTFGPTDSVLDTGSASATLFQRNCATPVGMRKFISNIYYVRDYAVSVGDGIPTLMRSQFDLSGGTLAHQAAQPLIEGIEGFRVELGIDSLSRTGANVVNTAQLAWQNVTTKTTPTNRGDGIPDGAFVRCTTTGTAPCTAANLANVVAVKIYVLARNREPTTGYTDTKTYTLGSTTLGPFNDRFKRHVFSTTVRLNNVSGRRESP